MTIEIHIGADGKRIPLQRIKEFYALARLQDGGDLRKLDLDPSIVAGFVSHFETCSNFGGDK